MEVFFPKHNVRYIIIMDNYNEEQTRFLQKLLDAVEHEHNYNIQNRFIRGYSLGVLMATEVVEE